MGRPPSRLLPLLLLLLRAVFRLLVGAGPAPVLAQEILGAEAIDLPLREIPGPYSGVRAWQSHGAGPEVVTVPTPSVPGPRGSVLVWVRIDETLESGRDVTGFATGLVRSPGVFDLSLDHRSDAVQIYWDWPAGAPEGWEMRTLLPGLPGPGWYHLAFRWDAEAGFFDSYLNGTPVRLPGTPVEPWRPPVISEVEVTVGRLGVGGLVVLDHPFSDDEIRRFVPGLYLGASEHLLGWRALGRLDLSARRGALLHESALDGEASVEGWVMEGPGEVAFDDGWMTMRSSRPDGPEGHHVFWNPNDFPDRFVAEWTIQPLSHYGLCIVFFAARGAGGEDLFDPSLRPREGVFDQYTIGDVASYHISYYANPPFEPGRTTSNLRRNPGVHLVANGPPGILPGSNEVHRIRLMKDGAHLVLTVDDRVVIDHTDGGTRHGPVLGEGKIGLRQMQWMRARYRDFRVYELAPE